MKKLINTLPFILLTGLVVLACINPSIPLAIGITALSGLCGYRFHIETISKPDYEKVFAERLEDLAKSHKDKWDQIDSDLSRIKLGQAASKSPKQETNIRQVPGW